MRISCMAFNFMEFHMNKQSFNLNLLKVCEMLQKFSIITTLHSGRSSGEVQHSLHVLLPECQVFSAPAQREP